MPASAAAPKAQLRTAGSFADAEEAIAFLFFDSEDDPLVQYAETWLSEPSLHVALSHRGALLAAARGARLWLVRTAGDRPGTATAAPPGETYTCLAWASCARGSSSAAADVALCVGTSRGRLLLYAPDGELIHAQRLHDTPVVSVSCRAAGSGACADDATEDVSVGFGDQVARLDALDVAALLRRHAIHKKNAPIDAEWASAEPLRATKWDLGRAGCVGCTDAVVAGTAPASLYDALAQAGASSAAPHATRLLTAGEAPALAAWAGAEAEGSVLAAAAALAVTAVSAVASGVFNLLRGGASKTASAAASTQAGGGGAASAADEPPPALHGSARGGLDDQPRRGRLLRLAPRGALAAAADTLGRVMLLDLQAGPLCAARLWKGYRDAHVAWTDGPAPQDAAAHDDADDAGAPPVPPPLCLAVLAPHRGGLLEVWPARAGGARLAKLRAGANTRLLGAGPLFGAGGACFGATASAAAPPVECFVLDGNSGSLKALAWEWNE